ncbi:MAG: hypothetical protein H6508_03755 [Calditrichaeota bacterium]|nr:hypothetical protein [Calditrichota bacterium]MCB9366290.1 hypothetical protein [Calditrichota bacterium]
MLAKTLYNGLFYPLISLGAAIGGVFSRKLRTGLEGRIGLAERARTFREQQQKAKVVLFHCASAGELEGVKPVADAFRKRGWLCAASYFSPSALTALRGAEFDFADYSPRDSVVSMRDYLQALRPDVVLISKHDVWPNMVWQSKSLGIPVWLINGNFHAGTSKQYPGLRQFHRAIHRELSGILAVSEADAQRARLIAGNTTYVAAVGDSRFDRVTSRARNIALADDFLSSAISGRHVIVAGSTHEKDEALLIGALSKAIQEIPEFLMLLVPHDPSEEALRRILERAQDAGLHAADSSEQAPDVSLLVINHSGVLADMYRFGHLAYVGGGFDRGVHSVLEPMAHGCEVVCGPNIGVSREANDALKEGLLAVVQDSVALEAELRRRRDEIKTMDVRIFVEQRSGISEKILEHVVK